VSDFDGKIVTLLDGDHLNWVCIVKIVKKKVQALNEKSRDVSFSEDKIFWHTNYRVNSSNEWSDRIFKIQNKINELAKSIDVELLWETAQELGTFELKDLAELFFSGEITIEHQAALWQAFVLDGLYFKLRGKNWEVRSLAQVEELKLQRKREIEKKQFAQFAETWLKQAIEAEVIEITEENRYLFERLECWMRGDKDKELEPLLQTLAEAESQIPRGLVFDLLQKSGRIPADADRDVIVAGLKLEFSQPILEAARAVQAWLPDPARKIYDLAFSIDDDDTREVDDALHIDREKDGWRVFVGIADPAAVMQRGDALDREAMRRSTTVYLPTCTVLMLPEHISCDISSLTAETVRSSVLLQAKIDFSGNILESKISREAIRVQKRLNYNEADKLLEEKQGDTAQRLVELKQLSDLLLKQRLENGALSFNRPEYKIKVKNDEIKVEVLERNSPSRQLVAEMMILVNHLAAKYAQRNQVPLIFRTQEAPLETISQEMMQDPLVFQKVRKFIKPSSLSLQPAQHSGLGLSVYTQFSSPLRRFADLVMQRQLDAHLNGETLAYDQQELFQVLATAEQAAREARFLENDCKKRWFMKYLKQEWEEKTVQVLIVEVMKAGYKVEMQPWGFEAMLYGPTHLKAGQTVNAIVDKVRLKSNAPRLKYAGTL
jgi:exoribonuclease-2